MNDREYFTIKDAAATLSLSEICIKIAIKEGKLKSFKVGNRRRILPDELMRYKDERNKSKPLRAGANISEIDRPVTAAEAGRLIGKSDTHIKKAIKDGKLKSLKVGSRHRIEPDELLKFIVKITKKKPLRAVANNIQIDRTIKIQQKREMNGEREKHI